MAQVCQTPTPTAVIMSMSEFVRSTGGLILFISLISFVLIIRYLIAKNYNIRKSWHIVVFKLPIFGNLVAKSVLAKVSMVLGNLNQAGVDLIESIDIAKSVTTNVIIIESLENIKKGVFSGKTLTDSLANEKVFPSTFILRHSSVFESGLPLVFKLIF